MSLWRITWRLTATAVLEGLTASHEGTVELDGHFGPTITARHAAEQALAQAQVMPGDVTALEIRIEREGAFP